jgi:alpha-beta hydrolase superfamily lysophospholipase
VVDDPIGHVIVIHGIISHSGWYLKTGDHLASLGLDVHSLDRRGSGLNTDRRGDVPSHETWITDVTEYVCSIPPTAPIILIGISWGGLLATAVAKRLSEQASNRPSGLALLCPGFFSRKGTGRVQHLAVRIANSVGLGNLRFPVPLRDPELFTAVADKIAYIRDDPQTLREVTLRLASASADLYHQTIHHARRIETPTLLMLAGRDAIVHNEPVRAFVQKHFGDNPQVIEYPLASHTLEFEADTSEYLRDLGDWCVKVTRKP